MAIAAVTVSKITIGAVDYGGQIASANLDVDVEALDSTNFDSAGWKEFVGGAKSATLNLEFKRDTVLTGLQAAIWAALGTVVAFTYQLVETTISTTAPEFQGNVLITKEVIGASVNQLATFSVSWPTTGSIARDVTP